MPFIKINKNLAGFKGNYTTYVRIGKTANFISETACRMNPYTFNFERETISYSEAVRRGYTPFYTSKRGG
jgi:hypothetical protein